MCGFAAVVSADPSAWRPMKFMLASISSRGPDETCFAEADWFSLGFCRLSIVVQGPHGHQPVVASEGDVHLVFNGEIYNFAAIRGQIYIEQGVGCRSEAEALLQLYLQHGLRFTEQLEGDYAIVVLDSRLRTCFGFRDPFGVKPLYYGAIDHGRTWILSSHLKPFFRHPNFSTGLDYVALMERRVLAFSSAERTCFDAVRQLAPGGAIRLQVPGKERSQAIKSDVVHLPGPQLPHELTSDGVRRPDVECRRALGAAVQKRVNHSDVCPIVLALSGGIDSSLIAALASPDPTRVKAVTLFDSDECHDPEYAAQVSQALGLHLEMDRVAQDNFIKEFPKIVLEIAGPNPSYTPYFLGRAVRNFYPSAKVMLCGEGADEFFMGYRLLLDDTRLRSDMLSCLKAFPADYYEQSPLLLQVRQLESASPQQAFRSLAEMFQQDQLATAHLVPFDHGTMAHGVECRVPFLDYDVIRFIQAVPVHLRVLGSATKVLLRIVLSQVLGPDSKLARTLLTRPESPAFRSTLACRRWLGEFIGARLPRSGLADSELAAFAADGENLFWLASLATIYLKYRGEIDGMEFGDLAEDVFAAEEGAFAPGAHVQ